MTVFLGVFLLAYIAGSINFAIIFLKWAGKGDPRELYSGNAGVTNVYRSAGRCWAVLILLSDLGRAILLAWITLHFLPLLFTPWIAFALILGNSFPCFHKFRGGKGVAAYLGFSVLLNSWAALLSALIWIIVFRLARLPFVASFCMTLTLAVGLMNRCGWRTSVISATFATLGLIAFNHRKNISALITK